MSRFTRVLSLVLLVAVFWSCLVLVSAESAEVKAGEILLSETSAVVMKGKPFMLKATVQPANVKNKKVEWASSDENIAVVQNGRIEGKQNGECDITCKALDGSGVTAVCHVEVKTGVKKVSINEKNVKLIVGSTEEAATAQLTYTIAPEDASWQDVIWTSSNEKIATVSSDGIVKGIAKGQAMITASSTQPNSTMKAQVQVSVGQAVESIEFVSEAIYVEPGRTVTAKATVSPADATNKKISWSSSDESVATVSANGQIKGVSVGSAAITAHAADGSGVLAECQVTVARMVQNIQADVKKIEIPIGESKRVSLTIKPADATNQQMKWESSDEGVCTVDDNGVITAVNAGTCDIVCTTTDGSEKSVKISAQAFVPNPPILFRNIPWGANMPEAQNAGSFDPEDTKAHFNYPSEGKEANTVSLLNGFSARSTVSTCWKVLLLDVDNVAGYTPWSMCLYFAYNVNDGAVSVVPEDCQFVLGQYEFHMEKATVQAAVNDITEKLTSIYGKPSRKGRPDKKSDMDFGVTHTTWEDDYGNRIVLSTSRYSSSFQISYVWHKADELLNEVYQLQTENAPSTEGNLNGL